MAPSEQVAKVIPIRKPVVVLCAGQKCPEREGCKRFRIRGDHKYASFDIDRQRLGSCSARER